MVMGGGADQQPVPHDAIRPDAPDDKKQGAFRAVAVRYQVRNVDRSVAFYTKQLGFKLEQQSAPAFARVSNGNLVVWLSGPVSSGSRPMPDGRTQEAGGWNRLVLEGVAFCWSRRPHV